MNRVGQNLVRNSDVKVAFTINVLDSEEVNAFALPRGFFFVDSGLILKTESEAELAGVMANEIAHVAARHGTRQPTSGQLAQIGLIAASIARGAAEVYSWRVSSDVKTSLEREARRRKISMSAALDAAAREWLQKSAAANEGDGEQRRLQKAAPNCVGALASGDAQRSETASQDVRDRLRRHYGR